MSITSVELKKKANDILKKHLSEAEYDRIYGIQAKKTREEKEKEREQKKKDEEAAYNRWIKKVEDHIDLLIEMMDIPITSNEIQRNKFLMDIATHLTRYDRLSKRQLEAAKDTANVIVAKRNKVFKEENNDNE